MSYLASKLESGVRVDMERSLYRMVTTCPYSVGCYRDNKTRGCKTLDATKERVDEENMEQGCGMMPLDVSLEVVLLNYDRECIKELEE
ncbi:hypothetical protein HAX54_036902, partial [Datura stramonium]|nr:hypothetical protein [Datura stramonium]